MTRMTSTHLHSLDFIITTFSFSPCSKLFSSASEWMAVDAAGTTLDGADIEDLVCVRRAGPVLGIRDRSRVACIVRGIKEKQD